MEITPGDITLTKFLKKFTFSSDPDPGNKIVMSNGAFGQCCALLKLCNVIISK